MGENFKRKKAERFRHLQDLAYQPLAIPDLLTALRPEIFLTEYACAPVPATPAVAPGMVVFLCEGVDGRIEVVCGNVVVGHVDVPGTEMLRAALATARGLLRAVINRISTIGGFLHIRIAEPSDEKKH